MNAFAAIGMVQESALVAKETSKERAKKNWLKVKEVYKRYKAELQYKIFGSLYPNVIAKDE